MLTSMFSELTRTSLLPVVPFHFKTERERHLICPMILSYRKGRILAPLNSWQIHHSIFRWRVIQDVHYDPDPNKISSPIKNNKNFWLLLVVYKIEILSFIDLFQAAAETSKSQIFTQNSWILNWNQQFTKRLLLALFVIKGTFN
jgi:hypothetical protein